MDESFYYFYSNALVSYSGNAKLFYTTMNQTANAGLEKMADAYQTNFEFRVGADKWANDTNDMVKRLYEGMQLKLANPEMRLSESYPTDEFKSIEGVLTVVGLSPNNDTHIFTLCNENQKLTKIIFYYFDKTEKVQMHNLISRIPIEFHDVRALWAQYGGEQIG